MRSIQMPIPIEVRYRTIGRKQRKEREVIGVICPTPLALYTGIAKPIYVSLGDIKVDWEQTSPGFEALNESRVRNR